MVTETAFDLDKLVAARTKEALTKIAPKIIEIVETLGFYTPEGKVVFNEKGGAKFIYDPITQTVTVEHGANDMFKVNIAFKTVALCKRGSWEIAFDDLCQQLEKINKESTKTRNLLRICDNLGLSKP